MLHWVNYPIEALLKRADGVALIKRKIKELQDKGENILNKNIPQELFS